MKGKIFRSSMLVALTMLLLTGVMFFGVFYTYFNAQLSRELDNESELIVQGVERMGMDYLVGLRSKNRITLVDASGIVQYDSVVDSQSLGDHSQREEIREAMEQGSGKAQRYSDTLSEKTVYVARRLSDGSVVRLASAQGTAIALLGAVVNPVVVILAAAVALATILAGRLCRKLMEPILNLDVEDGVVSQTYDTYEELDPLLDRLRRQKDTIRQQMDALRQQQQEFSVLTDNMSEGFLMLDQKGRILSHNSGVLRLLGLTELQPKTDVFRLEDDTSFQTLVKQMLEGRHGQSRLNRGEQWIQVLADPIVRDGQVAGGVLVFMDVTQREHSERMRREFTANVSHELKTPLTSISGMAEIIQNGFVRPEDIPGFAGDIYQESQRLIALVEDIIHLSRLDEGGTLPQREQVDMLELAGRVEHRLTARAQSSQVELTVLGSGFVVNGIPAVLEEMLYNLCDNGIKYNRPGGMVTVQICPEGVVTVSDSGIGIPAEDCERVFERFYRVDKSHSKQIGGTGLGLSIVKHGAMLHDASITLRSVVGQGTQITLTFEPEKIF